MPNGGSDNCNSCWFNERNDAVAGIAKEKWEGAIRCRLVGILDAMSEDRRAIGVEFTAMKQLGLWKELTATGGLRRVLAFGEGRDLEAAYALVALASVLGDAAEPDIELHLDRVRPTLERMDRSVDAELGGLTTELLSR